MFMSTSMRRNVSGAAIAAVLAMGGFGVVRAGPITTYSTGFEIGPAGVPPAVYVAGPLSPQNLWTAVPNSVGFPHSAGTVNVVAAGTATGSGVAQGAQIVQ